jgi:transcriptional regulator with XRE-family HTH domain
MPDHPLTRRLYLELGVRVRRRREALGKTQEELATDVGVSRSSIANIERGQQHAPVHVLLGLAEALRVEMRELLPTRAELVALVDASRDVPKLVNIGGESSLMTPEVVQLVGTLLTQSKKGAPARRRGRATPRPKRLSRED